MEITSRIASVSRVSATAAPGPVASSRLYYIIRPDCPVTESKIAGGLGCAEAGSDCLRGNFGADHGGGGVAHQRQLDGNRQIRRRVRLARPDLCRHRRAEIFVVSERWHVAVRDQQRVLEPADRWYGLADRR